MPQILAADIDSLTPEDMLRWRDEKRLIIDVLDRDTNMTEARMQRLTDLSRQADCIEQSRPLNLTELDNRLRNTGQKAGGPSSGSEFSCDQSRWKHDYRERAKRARVYAEKNYTTLVQMGGRPSRPIQYDPGHWVYKASVDEYISEEEDDEQRELRWIADHWSHEGSHMAIELDEWQDFRIFQRRMRRKPASLYKVQQRINDYWQEKQIREELRPQLHVDPQQQSTVDEWKEFYWYRHTGLRWHDEDVKKREQEKEEWLQKFDAAPSDPQAGGRGSGKKWLHGEWQSRERIVKRSEERIAIARNFRKWYMDRLDWIEGQLPVIALKHLGSDQASLRKIRTSAKKSKQPLSQVIESRVSKTKVKKGQPRKRPNRTGRMGVSFIEEGDPKGKQAQQRTRDWSTKMQPQPPLEAPRRSERISKLNDRTTLLTSNSRPTGSIPSSRISKRFNEGPPRSEELPCTNLRSPLLHRRPRRNETRSTAGWITLRRSERIANARDRLSATEGRTRYFTQ